MERMASASQPQRLSSSVCNALPVLRDKSAGKLRGLHMDKNVYNAFLHSRDQVRHLDKLRNELRKSNSDLARKESLATYFSRPLMNATATSPFTSAFKSTYLLHSAGVRSCGGLEGRCCGVLISSKKQGGISFRKLPQVLDFSRGSRMELLRNQVGGSSASFPVFSGFLPVKGQILNGKLRFRRPRYGAPLAASASGGGVGSEDEGDQGREDIQVREIIDVSNEAGARDPKVEAEIRYNEDYRKFRESLESKRKRFLQNLKEQHQVYKADREEWGVGLNPIFTVYEDAEGKRYKVDVDEDEIWLRSGIDPKFPQFADDEGRELVERRIAKAYALARKIVEGVYEPNELSVLYKFHREGQGTAAGSVRWGGDKEFIPPNFLPAPLQKVNFVTIFAFAVIGGLAYKWWIGRKTKSPNPVVEEHELRLRKMRKVKAKMNEKQVIENPEVIEEDTRQKGGDGAGRKREPPETEAKNAVVDVTPNRGTGLKPSFESSPSVQDEKFQRKVEEIRAMARQARLQEGRTAEAQSAQNLERLKRKRSLEEGTKRRVRSEELPSLAKDLDDVRRLGLANEESTSTVHTDLKGRTSDLSSEVALKSGNGRPSIVEEVSPSMQEDESSSAVDKPFTPESTLATGRVTPLEQASAGVKPRIILSAKEARASIAAKRARLESGDSSPASPKTGFSVDDLKAKIRNKREKAAAESINGTPKEIANGAHRDAPSQSSEGMSSVSSQEPLTPSVGGSSAQGAANGQASSSNSGPVPEAPAGEKDVRVPTSKGFRKTSVQGASEQPVALPKKEEGTVGQSGENRSKSSKEEEEEQEWMSDEVLRDIVFKVQANEEAGREPFFGLNSEQEKRFFRGLERKFEREGDRVKSWIKDRVENIDYGVDGVSVLDPPESYTMKWKEGMEPSSKASELSKKFSKDRKRLLEQQSGMDYTSSQPLDEENDVQPSQPHTPPSPRTPSVSPASQPSNIGQGKAKEIISGSSKTVVTSSGRPDTFQPNVESKAKSDEEPAGSWQNTKQWAKDLQRKYELEKDPETRALMREIGQDLDKWITEDEIEEASRLLEKGVEGEHEYVRMHYEKTKAKIKQQREMFGREAMMNKYGEYKPEQEEAEFWWFDLPYVLCLGLQSTVDGEVQSGLYSVDIGPAVEGFGDSSDTFHTVAFQDRGDAHNFCRLLEQESAKLGADGVEVVPFEPKELYRDAKAEGYKVTVIKKGQLQLSVDQPLEEVEARILEIGSSRYYDDLLRDRSIDMDAVLDEGLGYGQNP